MTVFHEGGSVDLGSATVEAAVLSAETMLLLTHHGLPDQLQLVPSVNNGHWPKVGLTHYKDDTDHYTPRFHAVRQEGDEGDNYHVLATLPVAPSEGRSGLATAAFELREPDEGYFGWSIRMGELHTGPQGKEQRSLPLTLDGLARAVRQVRRDVIRFPGYTWLETYTIGRGSQ